jgi:hypothetical protein
MAFRRGGRMFSASSAFSAFCLPSVHPGYLWVRLTTSRVILAASTNQATTQPRRRTDIALTPFRWPSSSIPKTTPLPTKTPLRAIAYSRTNELARLLGLGGRHRSPANSPCTALGGPRLKDWCHSALPRLLVGQSPSITHTP